MKTSPNNQKTVVLVYSGGLDTSICIPMMREEYGYERVVTVTVDVGQSRDDIAQAALFLCSPASNWITGTSLDISGGMWMD
mgnify:CR=1 FL=1